MADRPLPLLLTSTSTSTEEKTGLGRAVLTPKIIGYAALLLFFGGFGLWSAVTTLASAAIAPGVISPDGSRKTIGHLEGGIVREIAVREGDVVQEGDLLVSLEDIRARAEYESLLENYVHLVTLEARLTTELNEGLVIEPPALLEDVPEVVVEPALGAQQRLLESRRASFDGRHDVLEQRIRQLQTEIEGLEEVIDTHVEELSLIDQEIESAESLYQQDFGSRTRLLVLQRERATIKARKASNKAQIASLEQRIGETRIQLLTMAEEFREGITDEVSEVRAELASVRSQLPYRRDNLLRTSVVAPIAGTVVDLRVKTRSGVVSPGQPLMDLVPLDGNLIIDARVKPHDMDVVRAGQKARIVFPAYGQRNLPQIFGDLRSISADRLIDEITGEPYFLAKVDVDPDELERIAPEIELGAGMPAEVMILTGERTLLSYIWRPFLQSITRSFREL